MRLKDKAIEAFPFITFDKIRYRDTDRQGHVNNAVFGTYFETGRVELLYDRKRHILNPDCAFVVAKTTIDLLKEIHWPGQIDIGTGILRIGQSSIVIGANLYQNGNIVATSETIVVQVSEVHKTSVVLSEEAKKILSSFLLII